MILVSKKNFIEKIFFIFFIILFGILFFSFVSADIVSPTTSFYVNDYANVLSEETKNHIMNMNIDLEKKTGAQVVIVTIDNLYGESIETYSTKLFREFGIGDKDKNNGLLLLLVVGDRQSRIEVGYGLEGALTDGKTGRIQDEYMIPYFIENNWDSGIKNGFDACLSVIMDEYDIQIDGVKYTTISDNSYESDIFKELIFLLIPLIMVIIGSILSKKIGVPYIGGFYLGGSGRSSGHSSSGRFSGGGGRSGGGRKF